MKTREFRKCDTVDFFPVHTPLTPQKQQENTLQKLTELLDIYKGQTVKRCANIDKKMNKIEKVVILTPLGTSPYRVNKQQYTEPSQKPHLIYHKYNTRAAKLYNEAKRPRVETKIAYKGTLLNMHEVLPEQTGRKHPLWHQPPRVATAHHTMSDIPMEL